MQDFGYFLGRFHPLVVHLPIGFLLLGLVMEVLSAKPKYTNLSPAVAFTYLLGAISATLASALGFLLSGEGGYGQEALNWHMWAGIALTVFSWILYFSKTTSSPKYNLPIAGVVGILLIFTGHLGGNLTHGSNYLTEYAPAFIKGKDLQKASVLPASLDSMQAFQHAVLPVLEAKCTSCHNDEKQKGELIMTSFDALMAGGSEGLIINESAPSQSELLRRVTLDQHHDDFMPPDGKTPMTDEEIKILQWWLNAGSPNNQFIAELELKDEERNLLQAYHYGSAEAGESWADVEPVTPQLFAQLTENQFAVRPLAQDNPYLEVDFSTAKAEFSTEKMQLLKEASNQIAWLYLNDCNINDNEILAELKNFTNLRRLRLDQNPITDQTIEHLKELKNLEYLNLYGTSVTDQGLESLKTLPKLQKLYLWQTEVTPDGVENFKKARPDIEVNTGVNTALNNKPDSVKNNS